jgi:hypothetical protein
MDRVRKPHVMCRKKASSNHEAEMNNELTFKGIIKGLVIFNLSDFCRNQKNLFHKSVNKSTLFHWNSTTNYHTNLAGV